MAVDNHILLIYTLYSQVICMLAKVPGADDFIPEVNRPRFVPAEENDVLPHFVQRIEYVHRTARGIDKEQVS